MLRWSLLRPSLFLLGIFLFTQPASSEAQNTPELSIQGAHFKLNEQPFDFMGISFFNALYNPAFSGDKQTQLYWLKELNSYAITVIRIWAEWNNDLGFVNTCDSCILYNRDGSLRLLYLTRLKTLLTNAGSLNMVVELVLFSSESKDKKLPDKAADNAVKRITQELRPYRNMVFQIWNEYDYRVFDYFRIIKQNDPARIVSNSPGGGGTLGKDDENRLLDYLSPHTTRQGKHWEKAAEEIKELLEKFKKPVVDDEPARTGTRKFGGPEGDTYPYDQILHIYNVWKAGGYSVYHHDMFQTGSGSKDVPPSGIPEPGFSAYHKPVFEFLRKKERYNISEHELSNEK